MPPYKLGKPVVLDDIPPTAVRAPRGQFEPVYESIADLKRGSALPLTFETEKDGYAARACLRKIAKRNGEFLSSSRSADKLTIYFWIEPKGSVNHG